MYNLFVSHSWSYGAAYSQLCGLLKNAPYFIYKDYSVPKDDPLRINAKTDHYYNLELRKKLKDQMKYASVVLIMAGVYATYSDAIDMEIGIAKELGKPIIAVEPWGSTRTSAVVKNSADRIVAWNTNSIVNAIKELVKLW